MSINYTDTFKVPASFQSWPATAGSTVGRAASETIDPSTVKLVEIVRDPVIECDPVKCLKLLSNSLIVNAESLPSDPVLYVNAIFLLI